MDQAERAQAIRLLARTGNYEAVERFSKDYLVDDKILEQGLDLTTIFRAIKTLKSQPLKVEPVRLFKFLDNNQAVRFFDTNDDLDILLELLGALQLFIDVNSDETEKILAFDVLAIPIIKNTFSRRMNNLTLRRQFADFIEAGFLLVFKFGNTDRLILAHYFDILQPWHDIILGKESLVSTIIHNWALSFGASSRALAQILGRDDDWNRKFIYLALEKLIQLTSKSSVSRAMYQYFDPTDPGLTRLISDGLIERPMFELPAIDPKFEKLLDDYETMVVINRTTADYLVKNLNDYLATVADQNQARELKGHIASRMYQWLVWRKFTHLTLLLQQPNLSYSQSRFVFLIDPVLSVAWKNKDWEKLVWAIENLPEFIFKEPNVNLAPLIQVWKIYHDKK